MLALSIVFPRRDNEKLYVACSLDNTKRGVNIKLPTLVSVLQLASDLTCTITHLAVCFSHWLRKGFSNNED